MAKLIQRHTSVVCHADGREKTLYYTVVLDPDGSSRPGARWGCNDPKGPACDACWKKIKEISENEKVM